jgi:bacterial surface protein 26-residue repeat protein
MVAKQGFSPIEQYQRNASIGPWTDVYAMAATIYYCCTGILPPTAVDRIVDDTLTCQPLLTQAQFDVLAYCMSIRAENRPRSMTALLQMTTLSSEKKNEPLKEFSMAESPRLKEIKVPERATITMTAPSANLVHRKSRVMVKASCSSFGVYFWGQNQHKCTDVKRLTFQSTLKNAPSYAWDVSNTKDRSVLAWMINGHLYVAANGTIAANSDSSCMFANFSNMKKIDFGSCLDTTKVTDMSNMFLGCNSLASLNLTSFDTSNVMDMSGMFEGCPSLTKLDLSSFNTFNVKSMYHMFSGCSNLVSLNLSHFGSPYAADTTGMFNHCYKLKNINCFSSKILESYHSR